MSASSPKTWNKLTAASPPITTRACWRASITSTSRPSTLRSLLWNQPLTHAGAPPRRLGPITPPVDVCPSPQTCRPVYAFPPHLDLDWKPSADRKPIGLSQARPRRICAEKSSTALAASFQPTARRYKSFDCVVEPQHQLGLQVMLFGIGYPKLRPDILGRVLGWGNSRYRPRA